MNFFLKKNNYLTDDKEMSKSKKQIRAEINKALSKTYKEVKRLGGSLKILGLKAYNSKGANEAYQTFFKQNRATGFEKSTRIELFTKAKELGYTKKYNTSKIIDLNKFIKDKQDNMFEDDEWVSKFNKATQSQHEFTKRQIDSIVNKTTGGVKYVLKVIYTDGVERNIIIKSDDINRLRKLLKHYGEIVDDKSKYFGSDAYAYAETHMVESMQIIKLTKPKKKPQTKRRAVGWFPYLNSSHIDLSRYQIFKENNELEDSSCLLHSLSLHGIPQAKLIELSSALGSGIYITQTDLSKVADVIEKMIIVRRESDDCKSNRRLCKYGLKYEGNGIIQLGQIDNHFFINEPTKYTRFYIKHIDELSHINDDIKYCFTKKSDRHKYGYRSSNPVYLTSIELIMLLKSLGYFTEYRSSTKPSNLYKPEPHLITIDNDQRLLQPKRSYNNKMKKLPIYFAADMESDVVSSKHHQAIAISFKRLDSDKEPVVLCIDPDAEDSEKNLFCRFMNAFNSAVSSSEYDSENLVYCPVIYFHNAKYDTSLFDIDIPVHGECFKDGALYSKTYNFYGQLVEVRDSLKYFGPGGGLAKLPKMLQLGEEYEKGEAIGYTYHTVDNLSDHWVEPKEYRKHIKSSDRKLFDELTLNCGNHFRVEDDKVLFNPTSYYLEYLKQDVKVLAAALNKFRELIEDVTSLDPFESLTISSIGHKLAVKRGCYDDVYETKGGLRDFIQQAIRGGRVYANPDYVKTEIKGHIQDFDGVSLYPSAMKRLCQEHGIAKGKIHKGTTNFNNYKDKSYYIVRILAKSLGKKVQVPLISVKQDDSLKYLNDIENEEIYIDKYALEDLIKYQKIEFDIIEGVYWNEGYNTKIGILAQHLHEERCKHKKNNPALANVLKLLMNSIYGKTAMRRSDSKIVYVPKSNFDEYLYSNFGVIKEYDSLDSPQVRVVKADYDNSYSLNHVAVSILSSSKRIMNEVFYCMDECNMQMYYTDTDSIHMRDEDVKPLSEKYMEVFGRELIGKSLGQFHTDFDMSGCDNVMSIYNITLGPKSYLDILTGTDKNGDEQMGTHIRLKGITEAGINKKLNEYGENYVESAKALFRDLMDGQSIEFTLNPEDTVSMYYENNQVKTREVNAFKRKLTF